MFGDTLLSLSSIKKDFDIWWSLPAGWKLTKDWSCPESMAALAELASKMSYYYCYGLKVPAMAYAI